MKKLSYHFEKRYYFCAALLGTLVIGLQLVKIIVEPYTSSPAPTVQLITGLPNNALSKDLKPFNPNDLDANSWKVLGFTDKQISTILKYKEIIGGRFTSKEQLKKCYAISAEKFVELEPYIDLPSVDVTSIRSTTYKKRRLTISQSFNPNEVSVTDWIQLGFSQKQAEGIIKYKHLLGGKFSSKDQLKNCYFISDDLYQQLHPFIQIPATEKSQKNVKISSFNPNELNLEDWKALGFSEKQAKVILTYKEKKLKGSFKSLEDIKNCFVISEAKFKELAPFIQIPKISPQTTIVNQEITDFTKINLNEITYKQLLEFGFDQKAAGSFIGFRNKLGGFVNTQQILDTYNIDKNLTQKLIQTTFLSTDKVQKYSLVDAPEEWLQNHPYFKYSADKIIFYRINNTDEKKIWKLLKLKPQYEEKMRWYTK